MTVHVRVQREWGGGGCYLSLCQREDKKAGERRKNMSRDEEERGVAGFKSYPQLHRYL